MSCEKIPDFYLNLIAGTYSVRVGQAVISLGAVKERDCNPVLEYDYLSLESPLSVDNEITGSIRLLMGSFDLPPGGGVEFSGGSSSINAVLYSKAELGMSTESWFDEDQIRKDVLRSFSQHPIRFRQMLEYKYPVCNSDINIFNVGRMTWAQTCYGPFGSVDAFTTEITKDLVLLIDFDSSPCWHRKGYAPEPVKQHLMKFYLDYLSHVKIIPVGSVPDTDLPPLGFYPAEREEKAIDAEGRVVEPQSESSEQPLGW